MLARKAAPADAMSASSWHGALSNSAWAIASSSFAVIAACSVAQALRCARFDRLNAFVCERNGWIVSVPGMSQAVVEVPEGSTLPDELRAAGYDLEPAGEGERILPADHDHGHHRVYLGAAYRHRSRWSCSRSRWDSQYREISRNRRSEIPACALFDVSVGKLESKCGFTAK
jgi:hypothetical protein